MKTEKSGKSIGKKKAMRVFDETIRMCRYNVKTFGLELNANGKAVGFSSVITGEHVCVRTLNEMKRISKEKRNYWASCLKHGIVRTDEYDFEIKVLDMMDSTIENARDAVYQKNS